MTPDHDPSEVPMSGLNTTSTVPTLRRSRRGRLRRYVPRPAMRRGVIVVVDRPSPPAAVGAFATRMREMPGAVASPAGRAHRHAAAVHAGLAVHRARKIGVSAAMGDRRVRRRVGRAQRHLVAATRPRARHRLARRIGATLAVIGLGGLLARAIADRRSASTDAGAESVAPSGG